MDVDRKEWEVLFEVDSESSGSTYAFNAIKNNMINVLPIIPAKTCGRICYALPMQAICKVIIRLEHIEITTISSLLSDLLKNHGLNELFL